MYISQSFPAVTESNFTEDYFLPMGEEFCYKIPTSQVCSALYIIFPNNTESNDSCVCHINDISACGPCSSQNVTNEGDSICFSNLKSTLNGTLFHFSCGFLCGGVHCQQLYSIISSVRVIIRGIITIIILSCD